MKQYVFGNREQAAAFLKEKDDEIERLQGVIESQAAERLQGIIERQAREVEDRCEIERCHAEIDRLRKASAQG